MVINGPLGLRKCIKQNNQKTIALTLNMSPNSLAKNIYSGVALIEFVLVGARRAASTVNWHLDRFSCKAFLCIA